MLSTDILIVLLLTLALVACKPAAPRTLIVEDAAPPPLPLASAQAELGHLPCDTADVHHE